MKDLTIAILALLFVSCATEPTQRTKVITEPSVVQSTSTVPSDLNGDLLIDIDDYILFNSMYGDSCVCPADINGDGVVDVDDFLWLNHDFGGSVKNVRCILDMKHTFALGDSASLTSECRVYISGIQDDGSFYQYPFENVERIEVEVNSGEDHIARGIYFGDTLSIDTVQGFYMDWFQGPYMGRFSLRGAYGWEDCPPNPQTGVHQGYHYDPLSADTLVYPQSRSWAVARVYLNDGTIMTDTAMAASNRIELPCAFNTQGTLVHDNSGVYTGAAQHSSPVYQVIVQ